MTSGAMDHFSEASDRVAPYGNFRIRVRWNGRIVAGFSKVSAFRQATELCDHRDVEGSKASRVPRNARRFELITLERGVTHDREFGAWARTLADSGAGLGGAVTLGGLRKDVIIEVLGEAGQPAVKYTVFRCLPLRFQAVPDLDAGANVVAIQSLVLQNEGWECD